MDKNRGKWKIGVVTDLIKGRDGIVRAAKLRVGASCIERAVQHLFPLELSCDHRRDGTDDPTELRAEAPVFRPSRDAAVAANLWITDLAPENLDPLTLEHFETEYGFTHVATDIAVDSREI